MGGEDGPADVAVGGHGGQFPPRGNIRKVRGKNLWVSFTFTNEALLPFSSGLVWVQTEL